MLLRSPRGGGGDRLEVSDDRVDLAALQVMLEGGHARRALADHATDHFVAAARGVLGQAGAIGSRIDRGRQMTDTAGLREHLPAQFLRVVEGVVRLLRESAERAPAAAVPQFSADEMRRSLEMIISYAAQQRLIPRVYTVDELFEDAARLLGDVG